MRCGSGFGPSMGEVNSKGKAFWENRIHMPQTCLHHDQPAFQAAAATGNERRLIDDLIQAMDHPQAVISEVAVGAHFIGIRARDDAIHCTGLASTLGNRPTADDGCTVLNLRGRTLADAARLMYESGGFAISLGAAALNAGIIPPQDQPDLEASLIMAEKGKAGETVLVGDFPFTKKLRQEVKTLHLFELREVPGRTSPAQWDDILRRCSVLGLTGTTLITRAMATYLEKAPQAYTIIIGPTTPLSPVLFSYGADVLAGCRIISPDPVFEGIRKGMSFRHFKKLGVELIAWSQI